MSSEKKYFGSGIYKLTLVEDGRIYVGSSVNIEKRWIGHKKAAESENDSIQYIQKALRKYGFDSFSWEVLEICSEEMLIEREQYYLDTLQPFPRLNRGFNIREIADSNLGITFSNEAKQKLKGRIPWNIGKTGLQTHTQTVRDEMSRNQSGENNSFFGETHLDKTKKQISNTRKEKIKSGEITPTIHTVEHKKWLSESMKGEKNQMFGRKGVDNPLSQKYILIDSDGNEEIIVGLSHSLKERQLSKSTVMKMLKTGKTPKWGPLKGWSIKKIS